MTDPAVSARAAAVALIGAVLDDGLALSDLVDAPEGPLAGLSGPERARAQRLALATLRGLSRADACLKPFLRRFPPPPARDVLRLATVEMRALGGDPHGVVNSAVGLLRAERRTSRQAGLANAVLRRVAETQDPAWDDLQPQRLPNWIRGRVSAAWGGRVVARIEAAQAHPPPVDLTLRDPATATELAADLGAEVLPTGGLRLTRPGQISALPGYAEGRWWVQDAAAGLAARALAVRPGETVLDLCAAPGGKTLQLAAAGAEVTALDVSNRRLARLRDNLDRTGLAAQVIAVDALAWSGGPFDAILLDAPCSATGTIRRHPDLPFAKEAAQLKPLVALQAALIERAAGWLKPGGRLVYCTCSLFREEGEDQATAALARGVGLVPTPEALDLPGVEAAWRSDEGLRLRPDYWPDRGGMDGFFIAAFRKV
ncbi:MAG: RsmB/NOP family class I SAM-dependent RNA methyltransferase [Qingshengfaniella sp.]